MAHPPTGLVERRHPALLLALSLALATLFSCGQPEAPPELAGPRNLVPTASTGPLAIEKLVYVPIYSSLYVSERARPVDMLATLSLRNVSEAVPVVVSRVDYFDSDGELIHSYIAGPHELGPMQTAEFVIPRTDRRGGSGANFLVAWGLREPGPDLLVEAVMQGHDGNVGISFVTEGHLVSQTPSASQSSTP